MKKILWLALLLASSPTQAQTPTTPAIAAMVCANNTVVPTPVDGQFFYVQCDSNGKLITTSSGAPTGPAGGALAGTYPNPTLAQISVAAGKNITLSNSFTITANDGATLNIGAGGTVGPFTIGTTTISGGSTNGLLYNNAGVAGNLTTVNSGVLVTSGAGVPSISTTLPSGVALGSSLTFGTHLTSGGSSYNGSAAVTITSDATNANTVSTIVARDGSGNFSAGTITASLTGHASLDCALTGCTMSGAMVGTTLALSGCTLSANVLCATGNFLLNGLITVSGGGITIGAGNSFSSSGRGDMSNTADGVFQFRNAAQTNSFTFTAGCATATPCMQLTQTTDAASSTGGVLQVAGGASIAKRFWIPAISASAGLQTAVLCQSSGGEMIADSVACLASSARFKNIHGQLPNGALTKFMKLPIKVWAYKSEGIFKEGEWTRDRIGPIAEDVADLDPRLVEYDREGNVRAYSTEQLLAYTIKVVQEQQVQIDNLRDRAK